MKGRLATMSILASIIKDFLGEASRKPSRHSLNKNHYSCLTRSSWTSLFDRVGFNILESRDLNVQLIFGPDIWYSFFLKKP
jgi:hypothetical protein